jgi:hypothetical protein
MTKEIQYAKPVSRDYAYWLSARLTSLVRAGRDDLRALRNRIGLCIHRASGDQVVIAPWDENEAQRQIFDD